MKILAVNVFQSRGSTGSIVTNLLDYLETRGCKTVYCYRDGQQSDNLTQYKIGSRIETALSYRLGYYFGDRYGFSFFSTAKLIHIIAKERPDLIMLHSINGSYINIYWLLSWIKKHNLPVMFTHHSEYLYTGNCTHAIECDKWKTGCGNCEHLQEYHISRYIDTSAISYCKMLKAFSGVKQCCGIGVSPWVMLRAKQSRIMDGIKQITIENGVNDAMFYPHEVTSLRTNLGISSDSKIVLFSTALFSNSQNDIKGGRFILQLAKAQKNSNIIFLVVALENRVDSVPDNVIVVNAVSEQEIMAQYYSLADVLALTSKRETFSMPTAEALMCGTPVVGFYAGGPESIAISEYSQFVPYGDTMLLNNAITQMLTSDLDRCQIAREAKEKYSRTIMCEKYFSEIVQLTNEGKNEKSS